MRSTFYIHSWRWRLHLYLFHACFWFLIVSLNHLLTPVKFWMTTPNGNWHWKKLKSCRRQSRFKTIALEMQSRESNNLALTDLRFTTKHQSDRIAKLEARIQDFEILFTTEENGPINNIDPNEWIQWNQL